MTIRRKKTVGAPRAPRARGGRNRQRQRLIDACISALHIYGPSRTTVEKVVAIAKMSPGIVRFYFDSKAAMLVASLQYLAAEFEEQVLVPVAKLKSRPVAALELMVDLYLDPDIASPRKVSVWYAFWGEASSRQEYYDICGQKDESFAALVRELVEALIVATAQRQLDPDSVALGLIGALEMMWQEFAFKTEREIDRTLARSRCLGYLRSVFPGQFAGSGTSAPQAGRIGVRGARFARWVYDSPSIHALEREILLAQAWAFVAHESQVSRARDFVTVDIGAERALVVRNDRGELHVFRNSCPDSPHALVAGRQGRLEREIECRPHRLRFSLDGEPVEGPGGVDLKRLDFRTVGGLIFARSPAGTRTRDASASPEAWFDADLPKGLMALECPFELSVAADWKIVVEQWLESSPRELAATAAEDSLLWHPAIQSDAGWSARLYRRLVQCTPPGHWRRQFMMPNQLIEMRPDGISVVQALPTAAGRCLLRRSDYTILPPDDAARAALYLAGRVGPYVRRSSGRIAESVQVGITEFAYAAAAGRPVAPAVAWFHDRLAARIPSIALDRPRNDP